MPTKSPTEKPTRNKKTCIAYTDTAIRLVAACTAASPNQADPSPERIAKWLAGHKSEWVASSWRKNKAAVLHRFQRSMKLAVENSNAAHVPLLEAGIKLLQGETQKECKKSSDQTSATKRKCFPDVDRIRIGEYLAGTRSPNAALLPDYLLAGVRCGLRPDEWAKARISRESPDGTLVVVVENAKHDAVRAHGATRTLIFVNLPDAEVRSIKRWMKAAAEAKDYGALIKALSDLLYKTVRKLRPRRKSHYALYSTRHQFAAIAKLVLTPAEVAAVMGHASDATATAHYGRSGKGGRRTPEIEEAIRLLPRPAPEEVERVHARLIASHERLSRWKAGLVAPALR